MYIGRYKGRKVAIKVLPNKEEYVKQISEIQPIDSKSVLSYYAFCITSQIFLVGDFAKFLSLQEFLPKTKLDWERILKWSMQLAQGIKAAHEHKLVHKHIKPSNLLIDENDDLKLGDTDVPNVNVNKLYMAPEGLTGGKFDEKSDIYSFAIVLWEISNQLLKGKREGPFEEFFSSRDFLKEISEKNLRPTIVPSCPPSFSQLLQECWAGNSDVRPSAADLVQKMAVVAKEIVGKEI